jgi:hypothetical protein
MLPFHTNNLFTITPTITTKNPPNPYSDHETSLPQAIVIFQLELDKSAKDYCPR